MNRTTLHWKFVLKLTWSFFWRFRLKKVVFHAVKLNGHPKILMHIKTLVTLSQLTEATLCFRPHRAASAASDSRTRGKGEGQGRKVTITDHARYQLGGGGAGSCASSDFFQ
jgi:hypothetical protein